MAKHVIVVVHSIGETGVMLSIDLSRLVSRVEDDARSRFRLLGSGRGAE